MKHFTLIFTVILICGFCKAQSGTTTSTTKTMTMTFVGYTEGDYPHLFFKDIKTGQKWDFKFIWDNNFGDIELLLEQDYAELGFKANPKYLNKTFIILADKKNVLDSDLKGNVIKKNGWVISKISLVNSTQTNTTSNKLPFVGKRWYSMQNSMGYGMGYSVSDYIEIKTDGSVYFGNVIITKDGENYTQSIYAGKFKNIIPCNDKKNIDGFPVCNGFYKVTSDMIYSVDNYGNILNDAMCCKIGFPDETRKCNCQSKLSTSQFK